MPISHYHSSDSDSSKLPSSDEGSKISRRRLPRPYLYIPRLLWLLALVFLLGIGMIEGYSRWMHPDVGRDAGLAGAMFVLGACSLATAFGATAGWFYLRGSYRQLERFEKGDFLAHWTCSVEEWHAFLDGEPRRRTSQGLKNTLILTVLGALAGAVFVILSLLDRPPRRLTSSVMLGIGLTIPLCFAVLGLVFTGLKQLFAKRRAKRLGDTPGDIYIGTSVAYCAEECWDWFAWKTVAFRVDLIPGSPMLLRFAITPRNSGGGDAESVHHVPVPEGKQADAERVISCLQRPGEGD